MPNARQRNPKRTTFRSVTSGRPSIVQPSGPLVRLGARQLDDAEYQTFTAESGNQHTSDVNERINFVQTGRRDSGLPYDTK